MKEQAHQTDQRFDQGVAEERIADPFRDPSNDPCAYRHPAKKDDQHDDLSVGAVSHEEPEVASPHRFVEQPGSARQNKQK